MEIVQSKLHAIIPILKNILIPLVGCSPYGYWYTPSNDQLCLFFNLSIDEIYHPLFFAVVGI